MTDIVEQAARVIGVGRLILRDNGKRNNEKIAQALANAGLLRDEAKVREGVCLECGGGVLNNGEHIDPSRHRDYVRTRDSRTVPTREQIADAVMARDEIDVDYLDRDSALKYADAVLELLDDEVVLKGSAQQVREEQ